MNALATHAFVADPPDLDPRGRLVAARFRAVMEALGLDLSDPNLAGTPGRVARAWREMFAGLDDSQAPELRTFPNLEGYSQVVAVTGIRFYSVCAHHFLPFFGSAHVGYLPGDRVVGLSKLARAVEHFARRPQIQERLTEQTIELIEQRLAPRGAIVVVEARHLCMEMRGVLKPGATTTTTAIRGALEDERLRQEFLDNVRRSS
jgi:GTP cyclohydrolase IA